MDLAIGPAVEDMLAVRSLDDERSRLVCGGGCERCDREVDVRRAATAGDPREIVQMAVRAAVDHMFGVGAGIVVGNGVIRCWRRTIRGRSQIPRADRIAADRQQFVKMTITTTVGYLVSIIIANVVGYRIARSLWRAGEARQILVTDRTFAREPVHYVNVLVGCTIGHDVLAGVGIDVWRRVAVSDGTAGESRDIFGAGRIRSLPEQVAQVSVPRTVYYHIRAVLLDVSDRIAGGRRRARGAAENLMSDRAGRPIEAMHMFIRTTIEHHQHAVRRVDVCRRIAIRPSGIARELGQVFRAKI